MWKDLFESFVNMEVLLFCAVIIFIVLVVSGTVDLSSFQ